MNETENLKSIIEKAKNIVFFGGAGVSTESGIPDFRGNSGLYTDSDEDGVSPETILSIGYFMSHPEKFYKYYRSNMLYPDVQPNDAHIALARLEQEGKLSAVITQNIDGLHQKAGSKNVIELHGTSLTNSCIRCGKKYDMKYIYEGTGLPKCTCGGLIRPDVVFYGEGLDVSAITDAKKAISNADVLIVGGTSLIVQPAASLINYYNGDDLIIINQTPTPYDEYAKIVIREPIGKVFCECLRG